MKQIRVYFFMAAVIKGTLLFLKEFHFLFYLPTYTQGQGDTSARYKHIHLNKESLFEYLCTNATIRDSIPPIGGLFLIIMYIIFRTLLPTHFLKTNQTNQ